METFMMNIKQIGPITALFTALVCTCGTQAQSASYPTRTIKLIVPYAPGGTGDFVARILAERVGADLGRAVIVDNRSGANGALGAEVVARSEPDGYTLLFFATSHVILPNLQNVSYDWKRDFTPASGVTATPLVFAVRAESNIRSLADLAATAKAMPDGIDYASGGAGTISQLAAIRLAQELQIKAVHVPYRGFSGAVQALLGGQVQFICATVADVIELAKAGKFRLLAVTAEQRLPTLPDVPTTAELGISDLVAASWNAIAVPANTPSDVVDRLSDAFAKAANDPGVQERLAKVGVGVNAKGRGDLAQFVGNEAARWRRAIEEGNVKIEK
jgi:tripartite-type tricarboxylate transporter receptor subunit TctC